MRWLFGGRDDLGHIAGWTPARAERAAEATARMLLGSVLHVRRQSPDEVRRAQFWREIEARQARPRPVEAQREPLAHGDYERGRDHMHAQVLAALRAAQERQP